MAGTAAQAEPYCTRLAFGQDEPPGLTGHYAVIGRHATTHQPYAGTLAIETGADAFVLVRTIGSRRVEGEAWLEHCSPDRFPVLRVRYATTPTPAGMSCFLRFDGDNPTRASFTTYDGGGLEAWYQGDRAPSP
ncbi:hypothetical protein ACQQ2N_05980 [Dokdonella sp. MW10]|uniref:hypothetical protein n=1 Tax=Dokdonella sp. MW10 TaxID=2992926 RepID=UPI003F812E71